jgi:hypothetical protein
MYLKDNCSCQKTPSSCCNVINQTIGDYFIRVGQIVNGFTLNQALSSLSPEDAMARIQLLDAFVQGQATKIRAIMLVLFNGCKKGKGMCCMGAAAAVSDTGVGYVDMAFNANVNLGIPLVSPGPPIDNLETVLISLSDNFDKAVQLILSGAGCSYN